MYVATIHQFYQGSMNECTPLGAYSTLQKAKEAALKFLNTFAAHIHHQHTSNASEEDSKCYDCEHGEKPPQRECDRCEEHNDPTSFLSEMYDESWSVDHLGEPVWQHNHKSFNLFDIFDDHCHPGVTVQILELREDEDFVYPKDVSMRNGGMLLSVYQHKPFYSLLCSVYGYSKNGTKVCHCVEEEREQWNYHQTELRWLQDWWYLLARHQVKEEQMLPQLDDVLKYCLYPYLMDVCDEQLVDEEEDVDVTDVEEEEAIEEND